MKPVQKLSKELLFIKEIENLKKDVDNQRPLGKDILDKVFQKLRLDWNYNTNAIEGNSFTRGETVSLLMEGITAKGKPLKDALDIKGHNEAIDIIFSLIKEERDLNEADIRSLHKIVLGEEYYNSATTIDGNPTRKLIKVGRYKTSPNHVQTPTGAIHYYASVEDTPAKMKELVDWYNEVVKLQDVNPIVLAALFHHRFVAIHPFDDGNGRMTRLLTNYVLLKFGYPVSVVKQEKRREYYATLAQADAGEIIPIVELIAGTVKDSLEVYLKAINGEDINEEDDIDKEIELFKLETNIFKNGFKKKDEIDLSHLIFELVQFPSQKFNHLSQTFNHFIERLNLQKKKDESYISVSQNGLKNIETYKNLGEKIKDVTEIVYTAILSQSIIGDASERYKINLRIQLNKSNYSISDDLENKINKVYTEKVIDDKYSKFLLNIINSIITKVKSNK